MNLAIQIASLIALISIIVLVVYLIIIVSDLRRIIGNWKKVADLAELAMTPVTAFATAAVKLLEKLAEVGKNAVKKRFSSEKK